MSTRQVRVSADVAVRVGVLADREKRSFANMVDVLLLQALEGAVLTERDTAGPVARAQGTGREFGDCAPLGHAPASRSVSAVSVPPAKDNQTVRPHMKKNRPAVECPTRVYVDGVCPDCGAAQ